MKCPKCGFNSFEYYDSCKKCSTDLVGYKQTYSIASLVLPLEAKEKLVTEFLADGSIADESGDAVETHEDIFSFDLPDESPTPSSMPNDDPFNFDEPVVEINQASSTKSEDDAFADLLESTSQSDESPFANTSTTNSSPAAEIKPDNSSPGEFDLESFSWDEPSTTTTQKAATAAVEDDFDSLFGDTKENS